VQQSEDEISVDTSDLGGAELSACSMEERLQELGQALAKALWPRADNPPAITGTVGAFELRGQVDFLLVLWRDGRPRLRLVECKASRRDRTYHRVQVTLYRLLLGQLLAASPLTIAGHSIDPDAIEVVVARIDEATGQGQSIPELPVFPELGSIAHDLRQMLAEDGPLDRILRTELDALPFQIDEKCDDCALSVHCLTESARQRRLEILGVAPGCVRALTAAGLPVVDDVPPKQSAILDVIIHTSRVGRPACRRVGRTARRRVRRPAGRRVRRPACRRVRRPAGRRVGRPAGHRTGPGSVTVLVAAMLGAPSP
jgi:hypothetical protein